MNKARVLVVDDEVNARTALRELLTEEGYDVEIASDGFKGLAKAGAFHPEVVLTDLKMPGMDGIELMGKVQELDHDVACIVMTAHGDVDSAVRAMRAGVADYLTKPLNFDELLLVLQKEIKYARLKSEAATLRERVNKQSKSLVGTSSAMAGIQELIYQIAPANATVLVTGESGTGKELVAAAIHRHSKRRKKPFVKVHCAALAESLLESELFGHEKGAFTGAANRREGRFEAANGGTLFLDEIGDITPSNQVKLLRVLQEREFERVGGNQTIAVDVRLVAATNKDLRAEVEKGNFREDLYYRLNVVNIELPPLRKRVSDIPMLAQTFLQRFAEDSEKQITKMSPEFLERLTSYRWPGNVRELENVMERAVVLCASNVLEASCLPSYLQDAKAGEIQIPGSTLADIEQFAILKTLEAMGGSTKKAAEALGISSRKIQYKLREYSEAPHSETPVVEEEAND